MAKITQPQEYTYEGWAQVLGNRDERKIANNTYVRRVNAETVAIKLHSTDVVTFHADGYIVLNSGGWQSTTTKQRMNAVLPRRYSVYARKYVWYVLDRHDGSEVEYVDNMTLAA